MSIFQTNIFHLKNVIVYQAKQDLSTWKENGRNHHGITLRISGHARFLFENYEPMDSITGAITFIPEGQRYTHRQIEASEIIAIHFGSEELRGSQPFVLNPLDSRNFRYLFNRLYEVWCENPQASTVSVMAAAYKIFESVISESEIQLSGGGSQAIYQALRYMHRKFSDPRLSIGDCAAAAGISEVYIRKLFKTKFNKSPLKYLCDLRIDYAKSLLSSGYYSIMEVAERSGFSSTSYFCSIFKEYLNLSPMEYARSQ